VVGQNTTKALQAADYDYVLNSGRLIWNSSVAAARSNPPVVQAYIGSTGMSSETIAAQRWNSNRIERRCAHPAIREMPSHD
jgi:hypothetical protein